MSYPFKAEYRAHCVSVIDGDTVDLIIDRGFHDYMLTRFRFARINTYELKSTDMEERLLANKAREQVVEWLKPIAVLELKNANWNLRVSTKKSADAYGRWLAEVFFMDAGGQEKNANDELLSLGLAKLYGKK